MILGESRQNGDSKKLERRNYARYLLGANKITDKAFHVICDDAWDDREQQRALDLYSRAQYGSLNNWVKHMTPAEKGSKPHGFY